jgi:type I restriction enzyme M protein
MVEMLDPDVTDRIADPSLGTAGFLTVAYEYLVEKYSSPQGVHIETVIDDKGQKQEFKTYSGDLLLEHRDHVDKNMFHGFDFDATMLRIAAMNLVMHGVAEPDVHYQDTLSGRFAERFPKQSKDAFSMIYANPPFKGSLDEEDVDPAILRMVKTKKTELLFVAQILRMLKNGGKTAIIVPDGVLFGSSKAHQQLRQHLIENNELQAVVSLPSGVFKPYAGVSTAILFITKGSVTDHVWFYDLQADGFSLDDKRTASKDNDIPDLVAKFKARDKATAESEENDCIVSDSKKHFWVSKQDIVGNKYDLSINRYKETVHVEEKYDDPKVILKQLMSLENEIQADLKALESMF